MKTRFLLLIIFLFNFCFAQKISRHDLSPINLETITDAAFEQGVLNVKFNRFSLNKIVQDKKSVIESIRQNFSQLFNQYQVSGINFLFKNALSDETKLSVHQQYNLDLWFNISFNKNNSLKQFARQLQQTHFFEVVEPVYKKSLLDAGKGVNFIPNDTRFAEQWAYKNTGQGNGSIGSDIKLTDAWDIETGNPNVIVSVHDMGIQLDHPDLAQNISSKHYNFIYDKDSIIPGYHGTHVAGTVAAVNNNNIGVSGIAGGNGNASTGVRLMSCQVYDYTPRGWRSGGFGQSFIYAADNGACISQNSWAYDYEGTYELSVLDAIDYFIDNAGGNVLKGGLVVFASGNVSANAIVMPSAYDRVIAVGATNNKDEKADYTTYGKWLDISAPGGEWIDGGITRILSTTTNSDYAYDHGTSMACPHVSGVAALIVSKLIGKASAGDVRDILLSTTDNIDVLNPNFKGLLGSGRLNAFKALQKAQHLLNSNTINSVDSVVAENNCSNITISWKKNNSNNNVIVFYSSKNDIGIPVNGTQYSVGNGFTASSKVIYIGNADSFIINNDDSLLHYFKVFSVDANNNYSFGVSKELVGFSSISNSGSTRQNFDYPVLQPTKEWRTVNTNNDIGWIHTVQDTANTGAGDSYSMCMYNYAYNSNLGSSSTLLSPIVKTNNADSLKLSFWHSYQYRNTSYAMVDTLEILVSTDCGKTFTSLWKQYGTNLSTTGTTTVDTAFYPFGGLAKWQQTTIDLSNYKSNARLLFAFKGTNGRGNNLFLDNINIETDFNKDVALVAIKNLQKTNCDNTISPLVILKNNGTKPIMNCTIKYLIDNNKVVSTNWNGNLLTTDTAIVSLQSTTVNAGNHNIKIYTTLVNDEYYLNDTIVSDFKVLPVNENNVKEDFEETTNSFNNWIITRNNGDNFYWAITNKAAYKSSKSLAIQNAYNSTKERYYDALTPAIYCNRNYDSAFLQFDYADALRKLNDSTLFDTLQIDVTKDCGFSWQTVWKKYGKELASFNQIENQLYQFIPDNSQWKNVKILLSTNFKTGDNIQARFRCINNSGNNMYLDNVNVWATITPKDLLQRKYIIYPNPATNYLFIQHQQTPTKLEKIEIINALGKLASTYSFNNNAPNDFKINIASLTTGVYFINLIYSDITLIERFVKLPQ